MKKVFYEKVGRKYVPVSEYDSDFSHSLPYGNHLVMVYPGGATRRYDIQPALAPMIAAGRYSTAAVCSAIQDASALQPSTMPLTERQINAWKELAESFGQENYRLRWPAIQDAAEAATAALQREAEVLLLHPAVKHAYEEFMLVCKLAKEDK